MTREVAVKQKPPADLEAAGTKMWASIADKYELRPDETRILEDACREADLVDDLAGAAKDADRIVKGSQGQPVINPLISELRQHRSTLASLLRQLHLPDEGGASADKSSAAGRALVSNRWHKQRA